MLQGVRMVKICQAVIYIQELLGEFVDAQAATVSTSLLTGLLVGGCITTGTSGRLVRISSGILSLLRDIKTCACGLPAHQSCTLLFICSMCTTVNNIRLV